MTQLNPRQREAVRYIDGPLLVLAGAGSGKTRAITHKIAYLIQECGIAPRHIAAVTFTNKAAQEMKERVGGILTAQKRRGLRISTFHTLGLNIIRHELAPLGYRPGFTILDTQESTTLIRELLRRETGDEGLVKRIRHQISHWKSGAVSPAQALMDATEEDDHVAADLYEGYNRYLRACNAVDFDDLILLPVELLEQHPDIRERWQNRIHHLLVDEYQDTNATQYRLVKLLAGIHAAFTVVGDDDQSIYAWRGACPQNMEQLNSDFPQLRVIKLEQNYRSMGCILKAANALIDNNPHLFQKQLWSEKGHGDPITVIRCANEEDEAMQVISRLIYHQFQRRTAYRDYAILYRSNHQSRPFEKALREQRIPYQLSGGRSFFDALEVRDLIAYLRLLINPEDDTAFLRVVNTPRREIGPATLERLGTYATTRGIDLFTASFELGLKYQLGERAHHRLSHFVHWLVDIGDRARRGEPVETLRDLIREIDYETWLRDSSSDPRAAERRMENVWELVAWLQRMVDDPDQDSSLEELLARIALLDILDRNANAEGGDRVSLMTLHAAKGLEFPHVYLVGMEEELLPHRNSIEEESIEEERRLAYVGITRAQTSLTLTVAQRRRRGGEMVGCEPSRFLDELPSEELHWEGKGVEMTAEERQQRGRAHLANLKEILRRAE